MPCQKICPVVVLFHVRWPWVIVINVFFIVLSLLICLTGFDRYQRLFHVWSVLIDISEGIDVAVNSKEEKLTLTFPEDLQVSSCGVNNRASKWCIFKYIHVYAVAAGMVNDCRGYPKHSLFAWLQVGDAILSLKFTGELNDKMKGFYRSKYFGSTGDERYGAVTQFEVCTVLHDCTCIWLHIVLLPLYRVWPSFSVCKC